VITNRILNRDALTGLGALPPASVPLTVTSPPFDDARDYGGHDFDFPAIAEELWRVTVAGGVVCWQIQDRVPKGGRASSMSCTSARQLLHFRDELGFWLYQTLYIVSWAFRPTIRRYYQQTSQLFVLSKGRPLTINLLKDRKNSTAGKVNRVNWRKRSGQMVKTYTGLVGERGYRGDTWLYQAGWGKTTKDKYAFGHTALMPEALARDLILSFSNPGDLVLDICAGAGTTCKMALLTGRRYLGFEPWDFAYGLAQRRMADAHRKLVED
jgi:site-specific DNA-methyltransferase (adenine-specific)